MLQVEKLIQHNKTIVEDLYTASKNYCRRNADGMENRLKNAFDKGMERMKNISSIMSWSAEVVHTMKPEETEIYDYLLTEKSNMITSWNESLNILLRVNDIQELLSRLLILSKLLETNNNVINNINLSDCLSKRGTHLKVSCIDSTYEKYKIHFSRFEDGINNYTEFCNSLSRTVDTVINLAQVYTFSEQRTVAVKAVNKSLNAAGITPDMLVAYTKDKIARYKKTIASLIENINYQTTVADAIFSSCYKKRHHYENMMTDIQNLALTTVDFLVYSKKIDTSLSTNFKDVLQKLKLKYFRRLTKLFKDADRKRRSVDNELTEITHNLKVNDTLECYHFHLYNCLLQITQYFSKLCKRTELLYVSFIQQNDYISEIIDFQINDTFDDFSADVYVLTLKLIQQYNIDPEGVFSYQLLITENKYIEAVQNITERNDEAVFREMQRKLTVINSITDDLNKVARDIERYGNEALSELINPVNRIKNTLATRCAIYSSSVANHVNNIRGYKVMDRLEKVKHAVITEDLKALCLGSDERDELKTVVNALRCADQERIKSVNLITVITEFYLGIVEGVKRFYKQYLHQIYLILRIDLIPVLRLLGSVDDFEELPVYQFLLCLRDVDIIKWDSIQLEFGLKLCRFHLGDDKMNVFL